jgi:SAM-dependent methyltransferase
MAASRVETGCGVDINAESITDARQRLGSFANLRFLTSSELAAERWHQQRYDVVTCMETLEHCTDESVELILKQLARLVAPAGRVLISVPVEIGIAFLVKLLVRKSAAWSGISAYRYTENYPLRDALRMICAGRTTVVHRPVYDGRDGPYHTHYGFNWRTLRERVSSHFTIEHTTFSPFAFTGGLISSQVWFICMLPARSSSRAAKISSSPA